MYPAKPPLPHILGRDGAGDVLAVGPGVENTHVGETRGILRGDTGVKVWGTFAEQVVVPAANVVPVPRNWSLEETAAAPLVFLTAWQALTQWSDPPAPPRAGSVLLVSGASGGVGTASVLLGKSMNLTVLALSRSAERREKLQELGADFVFDAGDPNLSQIVRKAIAPSGVDLAVDTVGGGAVQRIGANARPRRPDQCRRPLRRRRAGVQHRNAAVSAEPHRRGRGRGLYAGLRTSNVEADR